MKWLLDWLESWTTSDDRSSRRSFVIRAGRAAFGLFEAAVGGAVTARVAQAGQYVQCCFLSYAPNYCPGSVCPSGCSCYTWTCCGTGGCRYLCGECDSHACSFIQQQTVCAPGGHCPQIALP
jgi:hypothetical protein